MASLGRTTSKLPGRPRILVLEKQGKRRIENTREIITQLIASFPNLDVDHLCGTQLETMPIKQQVNLKGHSLTSTSSVALPM